MDENIMMNTGLKNEEILKKLTQFINFNVSNFDNDNILDNIKELCVKKLCEVVGIKCGCNYKNPYFNFFGCVMGQALCNKLSIRLTIAPAGLRLIKYNGINFISKAEQYLDNPDIDEAFIDVFDLTDDHKNVIDLIDFSQM